MNTPEQAQDEIIEEFGFFDDWMDRYQYLIDLGRKLPEFPAEAKTEAHRLHGCQSQVWMLVNRDGGCLEFQAVSDSAIVSGLIALLLRVFSGQSATQILASVAGLVDELGLSSHHSTMRSYGLHAMLQTIRGHAAAALDETAKAH